MWRAPRPATRRRPWLPDALQARGRQRQVAGAPQVAKCGTRPQRPGEVCARALPRPCGRQLQRRRRRCRRTARRSWCQGAYRRIAAPRAAVRCPPPGHARWRGDHRELGDTSPPRGGILRNVPAGTPPQPAPHLWCRLYHCRGQRICSGGGRRRQSLSPSSALSLSPFPSPRLASVWREWRPWQTLARRALHWRFGVADPGPAPLAAAPLGPERPLPA
mmetsp:Transcript_439/g.1090  ORF Transcript_439/g.1090 Transcript_439/m.1090 type:complete len:218 (+) Transcript_439:1391-2044(+)